MLKIPHITGSYAYDQQLALDGSRWFLRMAWNDRTGGWYLTVAPESDAENFAFAGARLSPGWPVGVGSVSRGGPPGVFFVAPLTGLPVPLTGETLGEYWSLYYVTEAEWIAAGSIVRLPLKIEKEITGGGL